MSIHYLIDENVAPLYKRQLLKQDSEIRLYAVGDPGCPPRGTLDPEILFGAKKIAVSGVPTCIIPFEKKQLCVQER